MKSIKDRCFIKSLYLSIKIFLQQLEQTKLFYGALKIKLSFVIFPLKAILKLIPYKFHRIAMSYMQKTSQMIGWPGLCQKILILMKKF